MIRTCLDGCPVVPESVCCVTLDFGLNAEPKTGMPLFLSEARGFLERGNGIVPQPQLFILNSELVIYLGRLATFVQFLLVSLNFLLASLSRRFVLR